MQRQAGGPDDLLPERSADDRDLGWGDERSDDGSDGGSGAHGDERLLREVPPHHDA